MSQPDSKTLDGTGDESFQQETEVPSNIDLIRSRPRNASRDPRPHLNEKAHRGAVGEDENGGVDLMQGLERAWNGEGQQEQTGDWRNAIIGETTRRSRGGDELEEEILNRPQSVDDTEAAVAGSDETAEDEAGQMEASGGSQVLVAEGGQVDRQSRMMGRLPEVARGRAEHSLSTATRQSPWITGGPSRSQFFTEAGNARQRATLRRAQSTGRASRASDEPTQQTPGQLATTTDRQARSRRLTRRTQGAASDNAPRTRLTSRQGEVSRLPFPPPLSRLIEPIAIPRPARPGEFEINDDYEDGEHRRARLRRQQIFSGTVDEITGTLDIIDLQTSQDENAGRLRDLREENQCIICYDPYEKPIATSCGHLFCAKCIIPWVKKEGRCPHCRDSIEDKSKLQRVKEDN